MRDEPSVLGVRPWKQLPVKIDGANHTLGEYSGQKVNDLVQPEPEFSGCVSHLAQIDHGVSHMGSQ